MNLRSLRGFALVTETRRVTIPAGDGVIRFEGVAGGILPESAIVTGLPDGVVEKNQDAVFFFSCYQHVLKSHVSKTFDFGEQAL